MHTDPGLNRNGQHFQHCSTHEFELLINGSNDFTAKTWRKLGAYIPNCCIDVFYWDRSDWCTLQGSTLLNILRA